MKTKPQVVLSVVNFTLRYTWRIVSFDFILINIYSNFLNETFLGVPTSSIGLQLSTEELMNTMPLRDTVAGEALSMLCGSKTTLQLGAMGIRSPFARVRVLLSSKTEFRFSIQMASTGPSRTIHMFSPKRESKVINEWSLMNEGHPKSFYMSSKIYFYIAKLSTQSQNN